jgi:hypothetical protein
LPEASSFTGDGLISAVESGVDTDTFFTLDDRNAPGASFGTSRRQYNFPSALTKLDNVNVIEHWTHLKQLLCHFFPSISTDSIGNADLPHFSHALRVSIAFAFILPAVSVVLDPANAPVTTSPAAVASPALAPLTAFVFTRAVDTPNASLAKFGLTLTVRLVACLLQNNSPSTVVNDAGASVILHSAHLKHDR